VHGERGGDCDARLDVSNGNDFMGNGMKNDREKESRWQETGNSERQIDKKTLGKGRNRRRFARGLQTDPA